MCVCVCVCACRIKLCCGNMSKGRGRHTVAYKFEVFVRVAYCVNTHEIRYV